MNITLRQVAYFIAVAEAGSVSGGAAAVGISQSAITDALKALEEQTGTRLFERHARGMVLTYPGHQFLRHARTIIAAVTDAQTALKTRPEAVQGSLTLGVTSLVSGYFLADLLARFRRNFPNVSVRVAEEERTYVEHLIGNGELAVALMLVSNIADRSAIESEILLRSESRVWLPPGHPFLARESVTLAEIAPEPLIALAIDEIDEAATAMWRGAGLRPNRVLRTASVEAVRSLVATGAGIAVLPDMAYRPWSLEGDRIEALAIADRPPTLDVGLVWRRGSRLSTPAETFIQLARTYQPARGRLG
ncbi:LysR family transcriptional regulator [Segnochrobactrum spirostomi]|uniref:LysR family transcriptional regulator n=1 Tax=Segnochrobactrum spirostomi TaxID=2608987 RepID=A0A6A7Y315_9HYPH|nr:LysR family transcriptional regulator [Segnochrobactrum spirostomi]MQT13105.1 LysR family transcriptional regulator [Segnochrobactrum spirostomi]